MTVDNMASITEESRTEPVVQYAWVDEDNARTSPFHKDIGKAIGYVLDWTEKAERLNVAAERAQIEFENKNSEWRDDNPGQEPPRYRLDRFEQDLRKIEQARQKLTRTGKTPKRLVRLVTRIDVEDPTDEENQLAISILTNEFGRDHV
jgi:hypothetical protein